jgi:hypothetical protein
MKISSRHEGGGDAGEPIPACQTVYHDPQYPWHLAMSVVRLEKFL